MKILIYLWLVCQVFYTIYTTKLINIGVNISPDRVLLFLIIILYIKSILNRKIILQKINKIELLMIFLSLVCTVSMIVSGANEDVSHGENRWLSTLFSFFFLPFFMFHIARHIYTEEKDILNLCKVIAFIGIYLGILGIFEHYRIDALVYPSYIMDPSKGLHFGRARGPFLNSGINGRLLIFGFVSSVFLFVNYKELRRILICFFLLPIIASIYFTYTRTIWLGFAGVFLPMIIYKSKARKYFVCLIILLIIGMFSGSMSKFSSDQTLFGKRRTTIDDRLNLMNAAIEMGKAKPLFGWGYGRFNFESGRFFKEIDGVEFRGQGEGNHNTILGLFAEVGLLGTVPYLLILFLVVKNAMELYKRKAKQNEFLRNFILVFYAAFIAYFISMQGGDVRWNMLQNSIMFLYAGIIIGLRNRMNSNER